jgi:hypothetical protein
MIPQGSLELFYKLFGRRHDEYLRVWVAPEVTADDLSTYNCFAKSSGENQQSPTEAVDVIYDILECLDLVGPQHTSRQS